MNYLAWIRGQNCAVLTHCVMGASDGCGKVFDRSHIEAAHQKARRRFGDEWVLPLCPKHHQEQHDTGIETWSSKYYGSRERALELAELFLRQYQGESSALEEFFT
jgi:hypothetical protein